MNNILSIHKPKTPNAVIFDSPHSGIVYPTDFKYEPTFQDIQRAEDKYVDELFAAAPEYGATLLLAHFPRSYIDPNRAIDDIDPTILSSDWPYGEINPTARSDSGIGLIRRLLSPGQPLYNHPLTPEDVQARIATYYTPYHNALENLLNETHYNFGQTYHINCHSMPNTSAYPKSTPHLKGNMLRPSDIVLSNRDGTTCATHFIHACRDFFKAQNLTTTLNDPYKGAELITKYAAPTRGRHSLQIEINRALYMNEETCEKNQNFEKTKETITDFIKFCINYANAQTITLAAD